MLRKVNIEIEGMKGAKGIVDIQNLLEEIHGVIDVKKNRIGFATILVNQDFSESYLMNKFQNHDLYSIKNIK